MISYDATKHKEALESLSIGPTVTRNLRSKIIQLVTAYWDTFAPEGIKKQYLDMRSELTLEQAKVSAATHQTMVITKGGLL